MDSFAAGWQFAMDVGWPYLMTAILSITLFKTFEYLIMPPPEEEEKAEVAPPSVTTTPEPRPSSSIYGDPILVLTPSDEYARWLRYYMPDVRIVVAGEPGWEGVRLAPDDFMVIYRKEEDDG